MKTAEYTKRKGRLLQFEFYLVFFLNLEGVGNDVSKIKKIWNFGLPIDVIEINQFGKLLENILNIVNESVKDFSRCFWNYSQMTCEFNDFFCD